MFYKLRVRFRDGSEVSGRPQYAESDCHFTDGPRLRDRERCTPADIKLGVSQPIGAAGDYALAAISNACRRGPTGALGANLLMSQTPISLADPRWHCLLVFQMVNLAPVLLIGAMFFDDLFRKSERNELPKIQFS